MTQEVFRKRFKTITEIYQNNNTPQLIDLKALVDLYYNEKSFKKRLDIRYGNGRGEEYSNTLREKSKLKTGTVDKIEYWLNLGFTLDEAYAKRSEFYKNLNKTATDHNRKMFQIDPDNYRKRYEKLKGLENSYKYWLDRGFSREESERIIKDIHKDSNQSLSNFIKRYGEEGGLEKFNSMVSKRMETRMKNFGSVFTGNRTSKASLKYFVKIYKKLRKLGISKNDIVWGIGSRKEFISHDKDTKKNYAYDFVVKSKKVVLEYNDPFWHARDINEWRNPYIKYEDSLKFDNTKNKFIERLGYKVKIIWSDDLPCVDDVVELIYGQEN